MRYALIAFLLAGCAAKPTHTYSEYFDACKAKGGTFEQCTMWAFNNS